MAAMGKSPWIFSGSCRVPAAQSVPIGTLGVAVSDQCIEDIEDPFSVGIVEPFEGFESGEHGLVLQGRGGAASVAEVVEGDPEGVGEPPGDFDGRGHVATFVPADDGGRGADTFGQVGLGPAVGLPEFPDALREDGGFGGVHSRRLHD